MSGIHPVFFLIVATVLEVSGDAIVRIALFDHPNAWLLRVGLFTAGLGLVCGYSVLLNLAPLEFRDVVGLYIATLFVVWQVVNFLVFRTVPTPYLLVGGLLIVTGGLIVSFGPK